MKEGFYLREDSDSKYERILLRANNLSSSIRKKIFGSMLKKLYNMHITPNVLTFLGLISAVLANIFIYHSRLLFTVFVLAYFLFDILDGASARINKATSMWGTALDDSIDLFIAFFTTLNLGYYSDQLLLASLAMAFLFFPRVALWNPASSR